MLNDFKSTLLKISILKFI